MPKKSVTTARKIAVVIPRYGLVGGSEKFVCELTERLALNRKYEIHVFANRWKSESDLITFHKVPIISFPKFLTSPSFAYFVRRKTSKIRFDLIHTHDRIFGANIFTMHGIPHRIWIHEIRTKSMNLFDRCTQLVEKSLVNNAKCKEFVAVSNLTKGKFLQEYPIAPEKIRVIHPGVDIDRFHDLDRQACRYAVRKLYGIDERDVVILFVGMNFEIKGLDNLMKAVSLAKSKYSNSKIKLLIVGKGNTKKYVRLAEHLSIREDVVFAGILKENIENVYMASDIYAMLSLFDTFGMTVLEAMAAHLPVIISENVGAKDLVQEGINGFVMKTEADPDYIADKIATMLQEETRTTMGQFAFETAQDNTWTTVARNVEDLYEQILNE